MKEVPQENNFKENSYQSNLEKDPVRQSCVAEVLSAQAEERETAWEKFKEDLMEIEKLNFGDHAFSEELLSEDFKNPEVTFVMSTDKEKNKVVGFTYAEPNIDDEKDIKKPTDTALISDTAVHPDYQQHHLVADMMSTLEEELRKKGYKFIERYSNYDNGYAVKIAKAYEGRIVEQSVPEESDYGFLQVHFKIKL